MAQTVAANSCTGSGNGCSDNFSSSDASEECDSDSSGSSDASEEYDSDGSGQQ